MAIVRLFASAREAAGTGRDVIDGATVADVLSAARSRYGPTFADVLTTAKVWVNGERFLVGTERNRVDVPAHGTARVTLPVSIRYDDFVRVLKSLKDHPRPVYDIQAEFRFDVPVVGTVRVPVRQHREIPLPELKLHI